MAGYQFLGRPDGRLEGGLGLTYIRGLGGWIDFRSKIEYFTRYLVKYWILDRKSNILQGIL